MLLQIKDEGLGLGEKPEWVQVGWLAWLAGMAGMECPLATLAPWRGTPLALPPAGLERRVRGARGPCCAASAGFLAAHADLLCLPWPLPAACLQTSAVVTYLRTENMCYPACPNNKDGRQCNKKLMDNGDGTWCAGCAGPCCAVLRCAVSLGV